MSCGSRVNDVLISTPGKPWCFENIYAQDTSGRIVAYELLSGSMLGVLALGTSSTATAAVAKTDIVDDPGAAANAEPVVQKPGVVWAGGGDRIAAVIAEEKVISRGKHPAAVLKVSHFDGKVPQPLQAGVSLDK